MVQASCCCSTCSWCCCLARSSTVLHGSGIDSLCAKLRTAAVSNPHRQSRVGFFFVQLYPATNCPRKNHMGILLENR